MIEQRERDGTVVRQPVGGDTTVTVPRAASTVVELPSGRAVPFTTTGTSTSFLYSAGVEAYRVR